MSDYRLQIVFEDGTAVRFHPGAKSEEGALISACTAAIMARGQPILNEILVALIGKVGVLRTEAMVVKTVERVLAEKAPVIIGAVDAGLREVFMALKQGVKPY